MADAGLLDRINAAKKRHAEGKHCVSDEFSACDALVVAQKKFNKLDATVRTNSSTDVCKWFDVLEERYLAEKRVWQLFTAGELAAVFPLPPSPVSRDLFPVFAYAPALLALRSAARG